MNWIFSIVRVIGASFPGSASLVQAQAELDSKATQERLRRLEDPISVLHPDVRRVAELIYHGTQTAGLGPISLTDAQYSEFSKALAMLDSQGWIRGTHSLTQQFAAGITLSNSRFVAYMAALFEDPGKMDRLLRLLEDCPSGSWLKGADVASDLELPLRTVRALFDLYAQHGRGLLSNELGTANYMARA